MQKHIKFIQALGLAALVFASCKIPNATVSVPEKPLPGNFQNQTDTANLANIRWRQYFADSLLVRLLDEAIAQNLDIKIGLQRIEAARAGVHFASGEWLPKVNVGVSAGLTKYSKFSEQYLGNAAAEYEPGKFIPNPVAPVFIGATADWELDFWKKLHSLHGAAAARLLATVEAQNVVVSDLVAEVAGNYFELVALDRQLEVVRQTIQRQQDALEVVKIQKEAGRANELAVQQFQAEIFDAQVMEKEIQQQTVEAENLLNFLLGRFPQPIQRSKTAIFQVNPPQVAAGLPAQLLANRPDIRQAERMVEATKFDLKAARAAFYPNVNLTAALGFQAFNPQFLFSSPQTLGLSALGGLVAPLVNKRGLEAQFNTAKAEQIAAIYEYQKTILGAYADVVNGLASLQNLQQIRALKQQQTEVLGHAVESSADLYKTARASYLEVLLAQQSALRAQLELIEIGKRQREASVLLYKALGGGWR